MSTNEGTPKVSALLAEKEAAELFAHEAKRAADDRRSEYAAAVLAEAFPSSVTAVFARNWDEDFPRLIQILGKTDYEIDTKAGPSADASEQVRVQHSAAVKAENTVASIGSDDDILAQAWFSEGDEDHDGWREFNLGLDLS